MRISQTLRAPQDSELASGKESPGRRNSTDPGCKNLSVGPFHKTCETLHTQTPTNQKLSLSSTLGQNPSQAGGGSQPRPGDLDPKASRGDSFIGLRRASQGLPGLRVDGSSTFGGQMWTGSFLYLWSCRSFQKLPGYPGSSTPNSGAEAGGRWDAS